MLKDITIMKKNVGKMLVKSFVLLESDKTIIYIPLNLIQQRDYERLRDISEKKNYSSMLEAMKDTTLDNGRNALVVYDGMIRIQHKNEIPQESYKSIREKELLDQKHGVNVNHNPIENEENNEDGDETKEVTEDQTSSSSETQSTGQTQQKRGRGRPPKNKQKDQ